MLSFEQKMKPTRYKFGLLYIREGQTEENEFYGNLDPSTGFIDFCKRLGQLIELKGHPSYRGGLDVKGGTTGELSLYTAVKLADGRFVNRGGKVPADACEIVDLEIMFHVAPFLPHSSAKDDQQLHKKRHLGNDIVIVIYKDGHTTISPDVFKSQFNHVYVVVTPCAATRGPTPTHYKVRALVWLVWGGAGSAERKGGAFALR
jgi:RAP1 GTPase activating protein 1